MTALRPVAPPAPAGAANAATHEGALDPALAARFRARDPRAFGTVFDRFYARLMRFVHGVYGIDRMSADEIVVTVFVRAWCCL
jgi:hypothetical protein